MLQAIDHLSVWEIAHRWNGEDPNLTDPARLPLPVQDTLRAIAHDLAYSSISVCNARGIQAKNPDECPSFENYWPSPGSRPRTENDPPPGPNDHWRPEGAEDLVAVPVEELTDDQLWEQYDEFQRNWGRRHWELVEGLDVVAKGEGFPKEKLKALHLTRSIVLKFCRLNEFELPEFWFTKAERTSFNQDESWYFDLPVQNAETSEEVELEDIASGQGAPESKELKAELPESGLFEELMKRQYRFKQDEVDQFWLRLRPEQRARIRCREVAIVLWRDQEDRPIAQLIKDPAMQDIGGAKHYTSKNVVHNWIKDLDPRPADQRVGRPKKS